MEPPYVATVLPIVESMGYSLPDDADKPAGRGALHDHPFTDV